MLSILLKTSTCKNVCIIIKVNSKCFLIQKIVDIPHVDFIKRGQHGVGVLCFLQPLGNLQSHPVHLHPLLRSRS